MNDADGGDADVAQAAEAPPSGSTGKAIAPIRIIEALLFASDTPLSAGKLAELLGDAKVRDVRLLIADLNARYLAAKTSFRIEQIAGGYQMLTQPEFEPWLSRLVKHRGSLRLSEPALETLAVVAYKQPVIRADVEAIRGVACGEVLNRLREMGLIRIVGRAEVVGRPILYGTTRKFLDTFGLPSLDELPPMEALVIKRPRQPEPEDEPAETARPSRAAAGG
jgi:segregation and condensation protein B